MDTRHPFYIVDRNDPQAWNPVTGGTIWLTASTREWAERKVAIFASDKTLALEIIDVDAARAASK